MNKLEQIEFHCFALLREAINPHYKIKLYFHLQGIERALGLM